MAKPDTYSDPNRSGKVTHHSARGSMPRNAGNFTRGSQLITHEYMMWFGSVRIPLLVWFFLFLITFSITALLVIEEHEAQMILMKLYAAGWQFMEFNSAKIINLTLPSGEVIQAPITMVGSHPSVVDAWERLMRAFWGSAFMSAFVAVPLTIWFVDASHKRGRGILEERHQRGAMLVDADELSAVISAHNTAEFEREAQRCFEGKTHAEVLSLSFAERRAGGIHHPYELAGVRYPWRTEQSHTMLIGTTGTGKTTQMRDMIAQMRLRRDRAVVFDLTGAYVEAFYNPDTDIILNPMDKRCPSWSVFLECVSHADFSSVAAALMPIDGGASEPFWILAARTLFVETCIRLKQAGKATNRDLASRLMMADLKDVHKMLQHTVADPLTAPEAARMAESIRAVFNTNAQALRFLPEDNPPFSICDWIAAPERPGSILFITSTHNELTLNRALLTVWMNIAVHRLMRQPRTRDLRTWFFFDEVHALHRLPAIEDGLQTARGFGGAFVLGIHSFAKLSETYGEEGAQNLASLARTKLILATADRDTAQHCSDFIGHREVRMMDEAYSYGYSNIRDAATITPRQQIEALVIPDDIMKLPSLRGFLVFPEGFDAARVQLHYKDYPVVAEAYQPRTNVEPLTFIADEEEGTTEAGGREGSATPEVVIENKPAAVINATQPTAQSDNKEIDAATAQSGREGPPQEQLPERQSLEARSYTPLNAKDGLSPSPEAKTEGQPTAEAQNARGADPGSQQQFRLDLTRRELGEALEPETRVERSVSGPTEAHGIEPDNGVEI
ncbi:MAG: type IV secretion system DNA-binding domain-containing protein [Sphingorhabdus sp.]|uniref:type IV secretion system DNA-binding domain-containing protein n=1 Tax=Sphingorhabdus sp. TaxID=1902408 RepID=UPI003CAECE73